MKKVWIVVANSSKAKFLHAVNAHILEEKLCLEHPQSHMAEHDLISDRPGEATFPGAAPRAYEPKTRTKVKERHSFARDIAKALEEHFLAGDFEKIYLIASPNILGDLRSYLSPNLLKIVAGEIDKDLILSKPAEIRTYLPPVL